MHMVQAQPCRFGRSIPECVSSMHLSWAHDLDVTKRLSLAAWCLERRSHWRARRLYNLHKLHVHEARAAHPTASSPVDAACIQYELDSKVAFVPSLA